MAIGMHITGSRDPRPPAGRVIYCDGAVDSHYREGKDLELSHWIPNRTPQRYKASTSTEICVRFAAAGGLSDYDLVVNNHLDTDGVLSTFVLLHPDVALAHRNTLVQAAEMGDFWSWGEAPAQALYQVLALSKHHLQSDKADPLQAYRQQHALVLQVLAGERFAQAGLAGQVIARGVELVEKGRVVRVQHGPRFASYLVPRAPAELEGLSWITPTFDEPLSMKHLLPPQVRAKWDAQRMQLVAVESSDGWMVELWIPGYAWAETVGLWRPPGLQPTGSSNDHALSHRALDEAFAALNCIETGDGAWALARALSPFAITEGKPFPVIGTFARDGKPAFSQLAPEVVAQTLARVWVE